MKRSTMAERAPDAWRGDKGAKSKTNGIECLTSAALRHGRVHVAAGSVVSYSGTAVVNAANEGCLTGGGVDGAITSAGGKGLAQARQELPLIEKPGRRGTIRCPTSEAKTTVAGDLLCSWVIHAVGPNYRMHTHEGEADVLLYMAYRAAILEARQKQMPDVAFSLLSVGHHPRELSNVGARVIV